MMKEGKMTSETLKFHRKIKKKVEGGGKGKVRGGEREKMKWRRDSVGGGDGGEWLLDKCWLSA